MGEVTEAWVDLPRVYNAADDFIGRNISAGRSEKAAFIDPERTLTYGGLREGAGRFANALAGLGVDREQRVALIMARPRTFNGPMRS